MPNMLSDVERLINNPSTRVLLNLGKSGMVNAFLTDDFGFQVGAGYNGEIEAALKSLRFGGRNIDDVSAMGNTAMAAVNQAFGTHFQQARIIPPAATIVSWSGNDRLSFTLPLLFVAVRVHDDPRTEVRKLLKAANPEFDDTNLLTVSAPNGYVAEMGRQATGCVSVSIGKWFSTPKLFVIRSVAVNFSRAPIRSGLPLYAACQVTLDAYRMLSASEIDSFFS